MVAHGQASCPVASQPIEKADRRKGSACPHCGVALPGRSGVIEVDVSHSGEAQRDEGQNIWQQAGEPVGVPHDDSNRAFVSLAESFGYRLGERPRLRFAESEDDSGLVRYTLGSFGGVGVVEDNFLYYRLPDFDLRQPPPRAEHPYWEFGASRPYEIALVGLAWALTKDTERYIIPHWNWKQAAEAAGASKVQHVRWEYRGDGFIEARSWEPTDPPDKPPWTRRLDYTGTFRVEGLPQLSQVLRKLADEGKQMSVFGLRDGSRAADVVQRLGAETRPELADLLEDSEWFIDLAWGYSYQTDQFQIATWPSGRPRFEAVIDEFRERIDHFELSTSNIDNLPDYMAALARLQGRT